jgi:uncharacterized membrane protein
MAQPLPTSRPGRDWTAEAADRIDALVEAVREKTTVPVTKAARALVYGLVAALLGILALVLAVIGLFRLHVYLPLDNEGQKVYVTYLALGAIFVVIGMFLWRKRSPRTEE